MTKPERVRRRTLDPNPYTAWHRHVGDATNVLSTLRNAERMFPYYLDAKTNDENLHDPPVRWSTSQGMALWGKVYQPSSSPLSHNTSTRRSSLAQTSSSTISGTPLRGGTPLSLSRKLDMSGEFGDFTPREGDAAKSFTQYDDENLSNSMKRSLKALHMLPYRAPTGIHERSSSGSIDTDARSTPRPGAISPARSTASRYEVAKRTSIAAEESLIGSMDKTRECDNKKQTGRPVRPSDLFGEFVQMKDALDVANGVGGVKVGFGGLALLAEHVETGLVTCETPLCIEVEFCTHGFDGVARGDKNNNKYYKHYMHICDEIELALYPTWNICFVIKRGKPRHGSFEVVLLWMVGSVEYSVTLFSKLCATKFPSGVKLCRRLEAALGITSP